MLQHLILVHKGVNGAGGKKTTDGIKRHQGILALKQDKKGHHDPGKAYGPVMRPRLSLHSGRNTQSVDRSDYEKDHLKDQRDISHRTGLILIILHESENNGCKEVDDQGNQLEGKDHPAPRLKQNSEPSLIIDKGYNESGPDQYGCSHGNKEQHGIDICRNDPVLLIEPSPQDIRDIKQHDSIEKMPVSYLGQLDPVAVSLL